MVRVKPQGLRTTSIPKSNAKKHSDADELAFCMCHCDGKAWFAAESGVKDPSNPAIGGLSRPKFGRMIFNHCLVLGHKPVSSLSYPKNQHWAVHIPF